MGLITINTVTIRGEAMELNKLYCMDNLDLMKELPSKSIDLIYVDVLYNTGRNFKEFIDDLGTTKDAIKWYEPRIKEMHRLLNDKGSIYLHCDYRLAHYLKIEMDKVFGVCNFINEIIWEYGLGGSGNRSFAKKHDNILFYSKTKDYTFNLQYEKSTSNMMKGEKKKMVDVWQIPTINNMAKERVGYPTQKPMALLGVIIKASSNEGDVVADFFMGSGTTIKVAKELNRNYIGCDINERAIEITNERIKEE